MKKTKKFFATFVFAVILLVNLLSITAFAKAPLDEIQLYDITVDMRNDGTMDIKYHVEWKVLDDTSEGPLTWVKIGIPNKHVDEVTALSSNIKSIKDHNNGSNDVYVRIDLDREYKAGEVVVFDFSIHQSHMYVIDKEDHLLRYSFTPGWFDEIEVKNVTIKWNNFNVIKSNASDNGTDYLVWNSSLSFGEKINASVSYNLDAFNTNEDEQYVENEDSGSGLLIIFAVIIVIIIIVAIIVIACGDDDDYDNHSGLGGSSSYRSHTYIHTHHSSCVSRCACVSHCACACACAGGGRAGCSKKDFYGTKVSSDMVIKVLEEDIEDK